MVHNDVGRSRPLLDSGAYQSSSIIINFKVKAFRLKNATSKELVKLVVLTS